MMGLLTQALIWLNVLANAIGKLVFAPVAMMPGWLSNTIISAIVGVLMLLIFKYTSNQNAIGKVGDSFKANMLALKLFKDSMAVTLQAQGQLFKGALLKLVFAIQPMLVVIVPVCLIITQMGLLYQARPLLPQEEAIIAMQLSGELNDPWPQVSIVPNPAFDVSFDQTKAFKNRQIYWRIKAQEPGLHDLVFKVGQQEVKKELVIGDGFERVSVKRPGRKFGDVLLNPWEKPFGSDSIVQAISIEYPDRLSKTSGTDWWIIYFFFVSMVFAFIFKPFLNVKI